MNSKKINLRTALRIAGILILLLGTIGAVLVYRSAVNGAADETGYEVIGGFIYPGGGSSNKRYVHELRLYGGKSAVLADDFLRWFSGLWHGTNLAYTIAWIAVLIALVFFIVAAYVPVPSASGNLDEQHNNGNT